DPLASGLLQLLQLEDTAGMSRKCIEAEVTAALDRLVDAGRGRTVIVSWGHRGNQSSKSCAGSLDGCLIAVSAGGRPRPSRSKIVIAAIRRSLRCNRLRVVSGYWAGPSLRSLRHRPDLVLDLWLANPRPCRF